MAKYRLFAVLISLIIMTCLLGTEWQMQMQISTNPNSMWKNVEQAIGGSGKLMPDGVFSFDMLRTDLNAEIGNVTLELASSPINYGLTGQVVDAAGSGIPGITVWAISIEGGTINATGAVNTSTNATGHYGFDLPPGNYTIMAELPGYSFTASTARVLMGNTTVAS